MASQKPILMAAPKMGKLADAVVAQSAQELELVRIHWGRFPNRRPDTYFDIPDAEALFGRDVVFLADLTDPAWTLDVFSAIYAIPCYGARSLNVVIPYLPDAGMERVDRPGRVVTANTVARLLSIIPMCSGTGPSRVLIYDIHSLSVLHYVDDRVVTLPKSAVGSFLKERSLGKTGVRIAVAFPDDGAYKRYKDEVGTLPTIICEKRRDGGKRIITIKEGNPSGFHVVIVDDLIRTGGTLISCGNELLEAGAVSVDSFATHPDFENEASWRRFLDGPFERVYASDSCPHMMDVLEEHDRFHVFSLAPSISRFIANHVG